MLLGGAYSIPVLFLSRMPTLLMHTMHAAQALVTDLSTARARASALGRLSLAYGVGMVTGAPLGGVLSAHVGYHGVRCVHNIRLASSRGKLSPRIEGLCRNTPFMHKTPFPTPRLYCSCRQG